MPVPRVDGDVAELALILDPMDGAVVMLVRAGDPHVAILAVDPEAGVTNCPVVGVKIVRIGEERAVIPETPRVAGEAVEIIVREQRGCNAGAGSSLRTGLL